MRIALNFKTLRLAALIAAGTALAGAAAAQQAFSTAQAAGDALVKAVGARDTRAISRVLGPDWRALLPPEGLHSEEADLFVAKAAQSHSVTTQDGRGDLLVGQERWLFPVPLVQTGGQWRFDPSGGREAVIARRIGTNELSAMQAILAYADAQRDYASADRNGDGVREYAQRFESSPGQRDGLIWSQSLGDESPLGEAFTPDDPNVGYHGYRFRILRGQGAAAPGGARSYMVGRQMTGGFAIVAWPVNYDRTGVMTFIANQDGVIYERDLGPDSGLAATQIIEYNPGPEWTRVPAP